MRCFSAGFHTLPSALLIVSCMVVATLHGGEAPGETSAFGYLRLIKSAKQDAKWDKA